MNFYFFDLDGTLEDSRKDMVNAAQAIRHQLELSQRPDEQLVPFVNKGMRELYINCFDDFILNPGGELSEDKILTVQSLYEKHYHDNIAVHTKLYPGVYEALVFAKERGRTAVITNKPEVLSRRLLDALGVASFVDLVVGGDTCSAAKPSPIPLQHALEHLGGSISKDNVFMVGDSQGDSTAGANCGAKTVWCAWGYQEHAPASPAPQFIARTPEDLFTIFTSLEV
jgi:2-phosphoglycolate phosphatase